jgi:hypothetical protein
MTEAEKKRIFLQLERIRLKYDALFFQKLSKFYSDESILLIARIKTGSSVNSFFEGREAKLISLLTPLYETAVKEFYLFQNNLNGNGKKQDFSLEYKASFRETLINLRDKIALRAKQIVATTKQTVTNIIEKAKDVSDHISIWYHTPGRILRVAKTEVNTASNIAINESADAAGKTIKVWISQRDDRVRESHQEIDGEERPMGDIYSNNCYYPGDPAGPAREVINCRCFQIFK